MAGMTLDEMRQFVRIQADADTVDAPDNSLLIYARMAYNDILNRRAAWPHLSVEYSLNTIAGTQDYLFTAISTGDLERITTVTSTSNLGTRVTYITPTDATLYFGSPAAPQSIQAASYTIVGNSTLRLYPKPASVQTYQVGGFRFPTTWPTTAGSIADIPHQFDEAICWFMLAKYYTSQEDPALASFYMAEYNTMVELQLKGETVKRNQPRPSLMGGNNRLVAPTFMDRVRGSLE